MKSRIKDIYHVALRECGILASTPIYLFCMVVFPILTIFFFTSILSDGQPTDMPCGVVDLDNTSTSRAIVRKLDSFEYARVTAHYPNVNTARQAIQRGEIYAFLYIPRHTTQELLASHQPRISFYYSSTTMVAGNMLFKDLKTVATLGSAAVGSAKLSALGKTEHEIAAFLQPIALDLHMIGNPWANYNVYLSPIMAAGVMMLFIFLITAYSIGTELKFNRATEWMQTAHGSILTALTGKLLPQFCIHLVVMLFFVWYLFGHLAFPHPCHPVMLLVLPILTILAAQGFGVFAFGLIPSLRMSMSICSLWGVLGFSACGATFPVFAMDSMVEAIAQLIPLRHYYMIYQICILNGYPITDAWPNVAALTIFAALPLLTILNIRKAMLEYEYIP